MDYNNNTSRQQYQQHTNPQSLSRRSSGYNHDVAARFRQQQTPNQADALALLHASTGTMQPYLDTSQLSEGHAQVPFQYQHAYTAEEPTRMTQSSPQLHTASQYPQYAYQYQQSLSESQHPHDQTPQYPAATGGSGSIQSPFTVPYEPALYDQNQRYPAPVSNVESSNQYVPHSFDHASYSQPSHSGAYVSGPAASGGYEQQEPTGYDQDQQYYPPQISTGFDEVFEQYQTQVRQIFTHVNDGHLAPTADLLLQISHYLLGNARTLELDRDNPDLRSARLELWETFNRCWLTTLQRQLDMTRDMFSRGGQQPAAPLSLLTAYMMETLGQQLVQLCDGIEKMGLVDYQMGVAEEEILDLLIKCLDLLQPEPADTPRQSGGSAQLPPMYTQLNPNLAGPNLQQRRYG